MKKEIMLNGDNTMDLSKFRDGKLLLQANTGGGKSWAMRRILEQSFDKIPQIILDTEGEFSTLRTKFDYLLIGKDQDIKPDYKTAGLLAHRLIKERVSAVIDLFELSAYDRDMFVRNFVDAMTNAPKNLWLPTLLVIDEAQTYAPEGDKTECGRVLHDAAFKFRKRNFGIIFATPRIAALSKNVISTCKNKLIGYTGYEGDMKRAAFELGFTSKEQMHQLRNLEPGEFFVFGPAICKEVRKIMIGEVKTAHGSDEDETAVTIAPPSARLKKALAALADLPQAAEEEARTIADYKKVNANLKRDLTLAKAAQQRVTAPVGKVTRIEVPAIGKRTLEAFTKTEANIKDMLGKIRKFNAEIPQKLVAIESLAAKFSDDINKVLFKLNKPQIITPTPVYSADGKRKIFDIERVRGIVPIPEIFVPDKTEQDKLMVGSTLKLLKILVSQYPNFLSKIQLATFAGIKSSTGSFKTYMSTLRRFNLIEETAQGIRATEAGIAHVGDEPNPPASTEQVIELWRQNLVGTTRKLFDVLIGIYPLGYTREQLAGAIDPVISHTTGSFKTYLSTLKSNGLIEVSGDQIRASQNLFID